MKAPYYVIVVIPCRDANDADKVAGEMTAAARRLYPASATRGRQPTTGSTYATVKVTTQRPTL